MSRVDASSLVALMGAAVLLALFYLTQSTQVAAMGYEIARLEAELAERRAAQQQLIWEIGRARSPGEIEARARSELRLKPLKPDVIRFAPPSTGIDR
jgi:cell division protein FtsB